MYRKRLLDLGVDASALDEIDDRTKAAVDLATDEAKAGAPPGADLLMRDVWTDGGASWRN
jgi:acetoin:2,6-dichlorophenolindophenol oxidoreductase subunit alpha